MNNPLAPDVLTAFVDIGETLGSARFSPQWPHRLERLDGYPQVSEALQELRDKMLSSVSYRNVGREAKYKPKYRLVTAARAEA
jgi:hypothetical protein